MIVIFVIVVLGWLALAVAGSVALFFVEPRLRARLVPAVPAIGAMALIVCLHATSLVTSTRLGIVVVAVVVAALLVRSSHRSSDRPWHVPVRSMRFLLVATVAGALPLTMALVPQLRVGRATTVQSTWNNDAFSYVTVSDWLQEHRALDRPAAGEDAPVYGYTRAHIRGGLRVGEELVQAVLADVTGQDPVHSWYTVMALYTLLLPGAYAVAAHLLGLPRVVGLLAGMLAGLSANVLNQVYEQNSASMLGIVFAPLAIALAVRAADPSDDDAARVPVWLGAGALAAFVGTYTEFLPMVGPGLVVFALARRPREWMSRILGFARVVLLSVAVAPLVWYNAERNLVATSGFTAPETVSAFLDAPFVAKLNRVLGLVPFHVEDTGLSTAALVISVAVVVGVLAAVTLTPSRRLLASLLAGSTLLVVSLSTFHRFPYGQQRAVQISHPLWMFAVAIGIHALVRRARHSSASRVLMPAAVAGTAVAAFVFLQGNYDTASDVAYGPGPTSRNYDRTFSEAEGWIEEYGGRNGKDIVVLESDFFSQLWLSYAARDHEQMSWAFLHPDYMDVEPYELFDGKLRRYALVGRSTHAAVDPAAVVVENRRFRLVDLSKGEALFVAPTRNFTPDEDPSPSSNAHWMSDDGEAMVLRTPGVGAMRLRGITLAELSPLPVLFTTDTQPIGTYTFRAEESLVPVPLPPGDGFKINFYNQKRAAAPKPKVEPRRLSLRLLEVQRG